MEVAEEGEVLENRIKFTMSVLDFCFLRQGLGGQLVCRERGINQKARINV